MNEDDFWRLIDQTRVKSSQVQQQVRALQIALEQLPPKSLRAFDSYVWGYYLALARKELWAAADTIMRGCSDDNFDYFRQWLILQGKSVVLGAVRNPDSLAELPLSERPTTQQLLSLAAAAYQTRVGQELNSESNFHVDKTGWPADRITDYQWTAETKRQLFPHLTAKEPWKKWH